MLIAESGLGKGFPIAISKKLVKLTNATRVISGRNTIQAILKELANCETEEKTGKPKFKDARGYVISGEFATLLQEDKAALPVLTELYDKHYNEEWSNSTKGSGVDFLLSPTITLFGGSTPEHFANVVPESDVKGGFVGRILTVYAEERSKVNPLADTEATNDFPFEQLAQHLRDISLVKGAFKFTKPAKEYWIEWYNDIRTKKIHDPTGAINRLPDNVLKVAMCLALAEGTELVITYDHLHEAVMRCMELTIDSRRLTEGKGKSELAEATKIVIQLLLRLEEHKIKKSKLLQMHYGQFDVYALDRIIQTLETAGLIKTYPDGKEMILEMPPDAIKSLNTWMMK